MIPAAKARCAEALAGPYIGNGELCALIEPFAAAFEPIKQYYCAFQLIEICIGFFKSYTVESVAFPAIPSAESPIAC